MWGPDLGTNLDPRSGAPFRGLYRRLDGILVLLSNFFVNGKIAIAFI